MLTITAQSGYEGPLAEYVVLRQEIAYRAQVQHAIMTTQLATVGAVFGFVLTGTGRAPLLLILPVTSYILASRLAAQSFGIQRIILYIRDNLHYRVPGGLEWDRWTVSHRRRDIISSWLLPLLLTFPGASALGTSWAMVEISLRTRIVDLVYVAASTAALADAVLTGLSALMLYRLFRSVRAPRRNTLLMPASASSNELLHAEKVRFVGGEDPGA